MFPHERSLVKRLADKPFSLLGVSCDEDNAAFKRMIDKEGLTWRNWLYNPESPISVQYHVEYLPGIFILDAKGVIRFTPQDFQGAEDIDRVVSELLAEAEREQKTS
jgi:AhpC/TSA family